MDVFNAIIFSNTDKRNNISDVDEHKAMSKLYLELYVGCLKFKENEKKKKQENIDCNHFYNKWKIHVQQCIENVETNR